MTVEGAVAISAAILAGSVALLGFGIDSAIEGLASVIIIWRFTGTRRLSEQAEERAQRLVAMSFFLLAPYIAQDAIRTLIAGEHPSTSWVGIGLSISSMILMPLLGHVKQRIGTQLGSAATAGEGTQNLLCAYLAAGVLVGLLANTLFGLWWLDPAIALWIAALAVHEGREAWEGEECNCAAIPGLDDDGCQHDCGRPSAAITPDSAEPSARGRSPGTLRPHHLSLEITGPQPGLACVPVPLLPGGHVRAAWQRSWDERRQHRHRSRRRQVPRASVLRR